MDAGNFSTSAGFRCWELWVHWQKHCMLTNRTYSWSGVPKSMVPTMSLPIGVLNNIKQPEINGGFPFPQHYLWNKTILHYRRKNTNCYYCLWFQVNFNPFLRLKEARLSAFLGGLLQDEGGHQQHHPCGCAAFGHCQVETGHGLQHHVPLDGRSPAVFGAVEVGFFLLV